MPASGKEFLDILATIECGFTLKRVRDMTRRYSQEFQLLQTLSDLSIKHLIKLMLFENDVKHLKFKRSPA